MMLLITNLTTSSMASNTFNNEAPKYNETDPPSAAK